MFHSHPPKGFVLEPSEHAESPFEGIPHHNLQRKAAIVEAKAVNHGKHCFISPRKGFNLDKTIFSSVHGKMGLKRLILKARIGNDLYWDTKAQKEIDEAFEKFVNEEKNKIIKVPKHNQDILNFMENDCDFKTEHADGTFMDHLHFCHDYGAVHYRKESPRVLFLHSIMGVGSNVFPMDVSKTEKLASLLTPQEFKHIEAFPSILRFMYQQKLTKELMHNIDKLDKLESIEFYRVIDNKPLTLSGDDLWTALNYQMVHQLDFLPATNWKTEVSDAMFQVFLELYHLLTKTEKLDCEVKLDAKDCENVDEFGMPMTLGGMISSFVPKALKRREYVQSIEDYSRRIGHDLTYKINWANM